MIIRRRVQVTGRVQGVGYRYACRIEAQGRRLAGWVCNRDDGSVEAVLEGTADDVEAMVDWCRHGPSSAQVKQLTMTEEQPTGESGFRVV